MAHLASVGSHAINGVAALHTELLKKTVLRDFHTVAPEKFLNVTNGVTPRRWLVLSNPKLSALITRHIGERWISDLEDGLKEIEPLAADVGFQGDWRAVKADNKRVLAAFIKQRTGITVDPASLFDIQVKTTARVQASAPDGAARGHALQPAETHDPGRRRAAHRHLRRQGRPGLPHGQADHQADQRRGAASSTRIRRSPKLLKVVFLPDFNVKNSHRVYPAADLSEQISTAGKEASGTGNMKFAMNGALTIGTLDGANVEIRDAVGPRISSSSA